MTSGHSPQRWRAAEFFAGIGLAGLGLERAGVKVTWSNDIAPSKRALFVKNFGESSSHPFVLGDLGKLTSEQLPSSIDLAWASFPCTDLSLAGGRAGLHKGVASSTFWHFIKALSRLGESRPPVIALENVTAFATSHSGQDIASAIRSLNGLGYSVDVLSIDARHFVPQSRPRLFLVGVRMPMKLSQPVSRIRPEWLTPIFDDTSLATHRMSLPELPPLLDEGLESYLEPMSNDDERWWPENRVTAYLDSLSDLQSRRLSELRGGTTVEYRTAYRRMRKGIPRWEMRDDSVAGCLRTASGGSSKQAVVALGRGLISIRWMTPREYATLMGAPDFSIEGVSDNQAYSGFGDAVCAPVVEWLSTNYLIPLMESAISAQMAEIPESLDSLAS